MWHPPTVLVPQKGNDGKSNREAQQFQLNPALHRTRSSLQQRTTSSRELLSNMPGEGAGASVGPARRRITFRVILCQMTDARTVLVT